MESHGENLMSWKILIRSIIAQVRKMFMLINGVKSGTSLRSFGNRAWVSKTHTYGWFQWYFRYFLGWSLSDDER